MDSIYEKLQLDDLIQPSPEEKTQCVDILNEVLQSQDKNYETYLSSQALEGTIVEEISEVDAQLAILEKKIKTVLIQNKDIVSTSLLDETSNESLLSQLHDNLEQLWEMDPQSIENKEAEANDKDESLLSVDALLGMETESTQNSVSTNHKDEFHIALDKLRQRVIKKKQQKNKEETQENLAFVLNNLQNITDLMELPFLTRTCIRTGHYQEAIMLYTYSKSLRLKFPNSHTMDSICNNVLNEIITTMLTGLVKLLSTNLSVNSVKKILNYLMSIPPFDVKGSSALLNVYLSMRYKFITSEISSYSLNDRSMNESLLEMTIKRKVEVVREHLYSSLNTYSHNFNVERTPFIIPLNENIVLNLNPKKTLQKEEKTAIEEEEKEKEENEDVDIEAKEEDKEISKKETEEETNKENEEEEVKDEVKEEEEEGTFPIHNTPVETNPLALQMVNNCIGFLLDQFQNVPKETLNNSICLQLVYCSFRLNDLNVNYHHCFLNRLQESGLFSASQIAQAIAKRAELASRYA